MILNVEEQADNNTRLIAYEANNTNTLNLNEQNYFSVQEIAYLIQCKIIEGVTQNHPLSSNFFLT